MSQPPLVAVDMIPRHLQQASSTTSSSQGSPAGTPPTTISQPRSPPLGTQVLSSSPTASGAPPASPSAGSSNRFGLSLGSFVRRPRGFTNPSQQRSPGTTSPPEQPPSPNAAERGGYGFPALRRTLSKRTTSGGAGPSTGGESSRSRQRRSLSQPPAPHGAEQGDNSGDSRPGSSSEAAPQFPSLTATSSLPGAPNVIPPSRSASADTAPASSGETHKLRLVPHLESSRSLHFEPIERDIAASAIVRVGRFTDRSHHHQSQITSTPTEPARVAFKSKVVSRGHADIWVDNAGKFFIKDTKSSSGTFLNHIRLSAPNVESRPFPLKDGDVLQLGVDYQGGMEEIYRCVKMRVELNRGWQRGVNSFNTAALAQLRALGGGHNMEATSTSGSAMTAAHSNAPTKIAVTPAQAQAQAAAAAASITDCCICLYPVTVCQALFIAPCSHVTHFKCIRPLVEQNYPGFCCPLCRTYADLEADVEIDPPEASAELETADGGESAEQADQEEAVQPPSMAVVEEMEEPSSRAPSIRSGRPSHSRRSSLAVAGPDGLPAGILVTPHKRPSRPSSRAPSICEDTASLSLAAPSSGDHASADPSASSASLSLPIAGPSSAANRVTPSSPSDHYASLANAATPPNNTFLATLAESGALHVSGAPPHAHPHGFMVTASAAAHAPMSLDAAMAEASASGEGVGGSGSGSGSGEETDGEGVGADADADGDDGETEEGGTGSSRENIARAGAGGTALGEEAGKDKGKAKEIVVEEVSPGEGNKVVAAGEGGPEEESVST
ncbi:hypothetical protein JCM21900_000454 [Sporobolomyces salmonicolor]